MTTHETHPQHDHVHGDCEHQAVKHDDHVDYLHDGHLHSVHGDHVDEHRIAVTSANPAECTGGRSCSGHDRGHTHSVSCGHAAVPHGDHIDYLVEAHIHYVHDDHCDDHGAVALA